MKNRTIACTVLCGVLAASLAGFAMAEMPTSSTGVTGSGYSGGHTSGPDVSEPSSGVPLKATAGTATGRATPNNGTIIDNAKPNDLPLPDAAIHPRTTTDNPSAKIEFGKGKSTDKDSAAGK